MSLPNLGGRFAVGATTFRLAVPPTSFSRAKVSSATSSELKQALLLEEVVFTAYYPADVQPKSSPRGLSWLIRPLSASLQGYANYSGLSWWLLWPIVYLYGVLLKIPVHPDAPLLNPHTIARSNATKSSPWPLVVFSHGLGGSRTAYSQLCTRIAAFGRVVLAIEHRDGSGSAVVRSSSVAIPYVKEATLVWPPDHPSEESNMLSFRGHQLDFRRSEIYHALRAIRKLVNGGHEDAWDALQSTGDTPVDWSRWTGTGDAKPIESEENVVLAGHSFGGATVLSILSNAPPDNEPPIPVRKALLLDPWLEPIPSPGPVPHPKFIEQSIPSILLINSENFTLWKDHFERLLDVGKAWMETRWELLTIARAQHISFSDFPILPLVSSKNARLVLDKILDLSIAFLDGDGCESVADSSAKKMEIIVIGQRPDGRPKRQIVAERGDVILH